MTTKDDALRFSRDALELCQRNYESMGWSTTQICHALAAIERHAKRGSEAPLPDERAAFEAWATRTHGRWSLTDSDAGAMWSAWQARATLAQRSAEAQEPHHWIVPDFGLLFPSEEAVRRYPRNIGSSAEPIACYTESPALIEAARLGLGALEIMTNAYAKAMKDAGVIYYPEALANVRGARSAIASLRAALPAHQTNGKV